MREVAARDWRRSCDGAQAVEGVRVVTLKHAVVAEPAPHELATVVVDAKRRLGADVIHDHRPKSAAVTDAGEERWDPADGLQIRRIACRAASRPPFTLWLAGRIAASTAAAYGTAASAPQYRAAASAARPATCPGRTGAPAAPSQAGTAVQRRRAARQQCRGQERPHRNLTGRSPHVTPPEQVRCRGKRYPCRVDLGSPSSSWF